MAAKEKNKGLWTQILKWIREFEETYVPDLPEQDGTKKWDIKARDKCKIEKMILDHEWKLVSSI